MGILNDLEDLGESHTFQVIQDSTVHTVWISPSIFLVDEIATVGYGYVVEGYKNKSRGMSTAPFHTVDDAAMDAIALINQRRKQGGSRD